MDVFAKEALDTHNKYRKLHNVSSLFLDDYLSEQAAKWAKYLASNNVLQYSNILYESKSVGENLARLKRDQNKGELVFRIKPREKQKLYCFKKNKKKIRN